VDAFELVPGTGVRLPHCAGLLRFGITQRQAQWMASMLGDVREGWMCGAVWTFSARCDDIVIGAAATGEAQGLDLVWVERRDPEPAWPARTPVVWQDIDLFGYPAAEVEAAIAAEAGTADVTALARGLGLAIDPWKRADGAPGARVRGMRATAGQAPPPAACYLPGVSLRPAGRIQEA
jgi:hypothetical protein